MVSSLLTFTANAQCDVTSDVNDICIGDEVRLEFSYPAPDNFSVDFNGVDQFVNIPHQPLLDFATTDFSVEFWFRADNTAGPGVMFSKISATGIGYTIGVNAGLLSVSVNDGLSAPVSIIGTTPLVTNKWYHCAVSFDRAGDCRIYLDGFIDALLPIVALGPIGNTDDIGVGGPAVAVGGLSAFFDGKIDEVRVWNRIIAVSEIQGNLGVHVNPDNEIGLNGYWDFNEGLGGFLLDCGLAMQDGSLMQGSSFDVDAPSLAWNFGVTWNTGAVGLVFFDSPQDTTRYIATSGYCKYECIDSLDINVLPCDSGKENFVEASVWIPNAFTPNGDTRNDLFEIKASFISYFEVMVYARNGNIVFHSKNIQNAWDGTFQGDILMDNTYTYVVVYRNAKNEEFRKFGYVTVIR